MTRSRFRGIELGRAAWGVALLLAPRTVLVDLHQVQVDKRSLTVARILGARQLTQAVLSGVEPSPEVLAMGVWVDVAHASTSAGLALTDRSRARAGLVDAAIAGLWAGLGYRDLRRGAVTPPAHDRLRDRLATVVLGFVPCGGSLLRQARDDRRSAARG